MLKLEKLILFHAVINMLFSFSMRQICPIEQDFTATVDSKLNFSKFIQIKKKKIFLPNLVPLTLRIPHVSCHPRVPDPPVEAQSLHPLLHRVRKH